IHLLKDMDIDEETLVVFTSDNGPHEESYLKGMPYQANSFNSFGPFQGIKRDTLEGGIRVPTLVRWPTHIPANSIDDQPSQFHDWMPTFANLSGLPGPALSDGESFVTAENEARDGLVYVELSQVGSTPDYKEFDVRYRGRSRNQQQVIFEDGYKGIRVDIQSHGDDFEIYDLKRDPRETTDLAKSNDYFISLQQRMKDKVLRIRRPSPTVPRPYDGEYVPGINPDAYDPKVRWSLYEGEFPWLPQTDGLRPVKQGVALEVDLSNRTRDHNFVIEYNGYIQVEESAEYIFKVNADTAAILRIHDAVVVDNESEIEGVRKTEGTILLQAGIHPYSLVYRSGNSGKPTLLFSYSAL
ncbi:MAG TPA: sulfatase, partial [Phycisphaerae bacterium]|nr:sulfatase [Phycisphaerae bacterium]